MPQRGSNNNNNNNTIQVATVGLLILFAFVAFGAMGSCTTINPGHRGIRVTLGKVSPEALPEGIALKWPLGVSRIQEIDVRQTTVEADAACFSKDQQNITIRYAVMYRVDPTKVVDLFQNFSGDPYLTLLKPRLEEVLKQVTANYAADELVQKRADAKVETLRRLKSEIPRMVDVIDFSIVNIDLSDEVEKKIEEKMVAEQDAKKAEFEKMRQAIQNEITIAKSKAEAESAELLGATLAKNPLVLQMEIIKKWNGVSPMVVVLGESQQASTPVILPINPIRPPARTEP